MTETKNKTIMENVEEMIKVEYFTEDKNLFDIFNQITKGKQAISQSFVDVGIYANEIGKRFEFLEKLKKNYIKVFDIYFVNFKKFERMENHWGKIKEKLISKNKTELNLKIENELHYFLIEILKVMEEKLMNKKSFGKIKENLYLEKISKYFVEYSGINWSVLNTNQKQFVQKILNLEDKEILKKWTIKIEKKIEELKQIKEQVEIGM
ncbi:unnamed protein product [Meloidogyne enterolobii]|uniref:Uncharacterized protein n=1 Tax=Meloidogyne enterolobii TaxID=390850 RepID=A0ACB1AJQ0_MELEN